MAVMPYEISSITLDPLEAKRIAEAIEPELFAQYGFTYPASYWWLDIVLSVFVVLTAAAIKFWEKRWVNKTRQEV